MLSFLKPFQVNNYKYYYYINVILLIVRFLFKSAALNENLNFEESVFQESNFQLSTPGLAQPFSFHTVDDLTQQQVTELKDELRGDKIPNSKLFMKMAASHLITFAGFQAVVLTKLEELSTDIKEIKRLLMTNISKQTGGKTTEMPICFKLIPMKTEEDYHLLENELKSNLTSRSELVIIFHVFTGYTTSRFHCFLSYLQVDFLKRGGGSSLNDNVYNVLRNLFSDELAKEVRLTATSGKLGFRNSSIADVVRGIIF